jgi:hypothetical protein
MAPLPQLPKIKLIQIGNLTRGDVAWQWYNEESNLPISPYISDADVAERWGKLYLEAIETGKIKYDTPL